ncbi:Hypothetical protein ABK1_3824 (plasmid) [Acinetobacter baumannii 1656-2]|nr:Hypothetical protein ABK1_3824 [Acinetobacter baumannii 1656-2]
MLKNILPIQSLEMHQKASSIDTSHTMMLILKQVRIVVSIAVGLIKLVMRLSRELFF